MRSVFTARGLLALAAIIGCGCGSAGGAGSTGSASTPSSSSTSSRTSSSAGPLTLAANPSGRLSFSTKSLTASAGGVTIEFTNHSPLPHNLTVASTSGKVLGATPTFQGSSKALTVNLGPGTYAFYCSVPGHRAAGMQGVLVVR